MGKMKSWYSDINTEQPNPHPSFQEVAPAEASLFLGKIRAAKKSQPQGAAVDVQSLNTYKTHKMFMTKDGMAGYSVSPEGELTSVFKHRNAPYEDVARFAAEHAVLMAGATHASAFDGYLTDAYARGGMNVVAYQPFADEYKPTGWKFKTHGRPDVAFVAADRSVAHAAISAQHAKQTFYKTKNKPYNDNSGLRPPTLDDNSKGYEMAKSAGEQNVASQIPSAGRNASK
jgi:hypothetical protein